MQPVLLETCVYSRPIQNPIADPHLFFQLLSLLLHLALFIVVHDHHCCIDFADCQVRG